MDKRIMATVKSFYSGSDFIQKNLFLLVLSVLTSLVWSIQYLKLKDTSTVISLYMLTGLIFIVGFLGLIGYFSKFIQQRLNGAECSLFNFDLSFFMPNPKVVSFFVIWFFYASLLFVPTVGAFWYVINVLGPMLSLLIVPILIVLIVITLAIVIPIALVSAPAAVYNLIDYFKSNFTKTACLSPFAILSYKGVFMKSLPIIFAIVGLNIAVYTVLSTVVAPIVLMNGLENIENNFLVRTISLILDEYASIIVNLIALDLFVDFYKKNIETAKV